MPDRTSVRIGIGTNTVYYLDLHTRETLEKFREYLIEKFDFHLEQPVFEPQELFGEEV